LSPGLVGQVKSSNILVFGSLVGRSDVSLMTLKKLLEVAKFSVFDVNLRKPHYHLHTLVELMNAADCIKLNDDELYEIARAMGSRYNILEQNVEFICEKNSTLTICVTKGRHGALLKVGDRNYYNSGYSIDVVDTVGAGDLFLASLIYRLCCTDNAQCGIDFSCAVGAMVAQKRGATPELSCDDIERFMNPGKCQV
jgi:fructokinase